MKAIYLAKACIIPLLSCLLAVLQGCQSLSGGRFGQRWHHAIPDRPRQAMSANDFAASISQANETEREASILREIRHGNIPKFLRYFKAIKIKQSITGFGPVNATFWVMPDYLSIGNDRNYLRIPMNPITAQHIADHFGCVLPTKKMVDLIYDQSNLKLKPEPMPYGPEMVSIPQYTKHNQMINTQLQSKDATDLIAGHKKDVVLTKRLQKQSGRVAIYGWHRLNGKAIQPLSLVHGNYYSDYSHGIRLVANMMLINDKLYPVAEVMKHPQLSSIISDEGVLPYARYPTEGTLKKSRWFPKGWNASS